MGLLSGRAVFMGVVFLHCAHGFAASPKADLLRRVKEAKVFVSSDGKEIPQDENIFDREPYYTPDRQAGASLFPDDTIRVGSDYSKKQKEYSKMIERLSSRTAGLSITTRGEIRVYNKLFWDATFREVLEFLRENASDDDALQDAWVRCQSANTLLQHFVAKLKEPSAEMSKAAAFGRVGKFFTKIMLAELKKQKRTLASFTVFILPGKRSSRDLIVGVMDRLIEALGRVLKDYSQATAEN